MAEALIAFKIEIDDWPDEVEAMEGLSGQSLEGFVDQQATAGRDGCINAADGTCQLTGKVCRWNEQGMVPTGVGGYIPGIVSFVSAEVSCKSNDCPSDGPIQKLTGTLSAFCRLAMKANDEVKAQTEPIYRDASERADAIVEPAQAEAERTILQPARERATAIRKAADTKAKKFVKGAKSEAESIRRAASDEARAIRSSALARVLAEAEAASIDEAKLF